jgi:hypothetical protein
MRKGSAAGPGLGAIAPAILLSTIAWLCSCSGENTAVLLTDIPEMAAYAELFNSQDTRHHVETRYRSNLAGDGGFGEASIVAGRWLRSSPTRAAFRSLDHLFSDLRLNARDFYPDLLAQGKFEGRQLLIPLSFNLPLIVFREDADLSAADTGPDHRPQAAGSAFYIGLEELRSAGKAFNQAKGETFIKIGFSPRWDPDFLYLLARLEGASFQQAKPLAFDPQGLAAAVALARTWVAEANGSPAREDEFAFKYLYDPGYRSVSAGRILFAYMDSEDFFSLPDQKRAGLTFRWIIHKGLIPVNEESTFLGITRKGAGRESAEAFATWLFKSETQHAILEDFRAQRLSEISFGIAGGFSSIKDVNAKIFPSFYPGLLGHSLPAGPFLAAKPLPPSWPIIKRDVVIPFLEEECAKASGSPLPGQDALFNRISTWLKENPGS